MDVWDTVEHTYPFARRVYTSDDDAVFDFASLRAWPARDGAGRDVVIKVVAPMELDILKWLNSPKARADPRNISIPVLEYIKYNDYTFVVMPRWDIGWEHKFYTVADLMHAMGSYLQGVDFLHENRIAHCDLRVQNIGLNIIGTPTDSGRLARDPAHALYTIFDFGGSFIYPRDTPLEKALPLEKNTNGDVNPFQVDVALLGSVFQTWFKPAEELLPQITTLLKEMVHDKPQKRIIIHQTLERFQEVHSNLRPDQLECAVSNQLKNNKGALYTVFPGGAQPVPR
ncbi:hypothetical protein Hypma_005527 [Hypsizygus marmoreus]|uniref:Protein kinase domain-containing protein n=1 Tax=Hypsizygus marmoreus TaxID=39966 RepID=A0A369K1J9_HYPMA|nr:hypothetical protein Hypma_005527 [Hypsizygus marmoreus]